MRGEYDDDLPMEGFMVGSATTLTEYSKPMKLPKRWPIGFDLTPRKEPDDAAT